MVQREKFIPIQKIYYYCGSFITRHLIYLFYIWHAVIQIFASGLVANISASSQKLLGSWRGPNHLQHYNCRQEHIWQWHHLKNESQLKNISWICGTKQLSYYLVSLVLSPGLMEMSVPLLRLNGQAVQELGHVTPVFPSILTMLKEDLTLCVWIKVLTQNAYGLGI